MVSQYNFPIFYFMERETSLVALAKSQSAVLYIVKDKNATKATFQTGYWVREHTRVWDFPNKLKRASGYSFAVLAPYSKQGKDGKGMERKREIKDGHIVVKTPCIKNCRHTKLQCNPVGRTIVLQVATTEAEACPIKFCGLWQG